MILAQKSILVVLVLISCWIAFLAAGIIALLQSLRLSYKTRKYWANKGVKFGLIWWNPAAHSINDPEYNRARNNINKVILMCIIIMFLSGVIFSLQAVVRIYEVKKLDIGTTTLNLGVILGR